MSAHLPLGDGAEFDTIRALLQRFGEHAEGIGDDAAVFTPPVGESLVVSVDAAVDRVHFQRSWLSFEEIAWRALHAALSDLAAMGATPRGVLLAWALPTADRDALPALADGTAAAAARARVPILGGNLTRADTLSLTTTVIGSTPRPVSRAGAQPGDRLYVTGQLGGPGDALAAWQRGGTPGAASRARFARPEARLAAGQWLAAQGARAMLDVSDGLVRDAGHLAAASAVEVIVDAARLPRLPDIAVATALTSGEEYELLLAAPALDTAAFVDALGLPLTEIGEIGARTDAPSVWVRDASGRRHRVDSAAGYDHFS